jgi:DNA repair ATPase RecN
LERVQESEKLLERIMLVLPGFRGYKQREQRREADRIVRDHIYDVLEDARDDLAKCLQGLSDSKATELIEPMNRLIAIVDRVAEKVNHASYGYSGFFDSVKIEEPELDRMLAYDTQLMDVARKFAKEVAGLRSDLDQDRLENARNSQQGLDRSLANLEKVFDQRKGIIEGVQV